MSLRAALAADIAARYGGDDTEPGVKPTADDLLVFLVARRDGGAVGCGGLRCVDAETAEIKRMYVVPEQRGTGVAAALLRALENEARAARVTRLVLETGTEQHEALAFYERAGYARCECWSAYAQGELSLCLGRTLTT